MILFLAGVEQMSEFLIFYGPTDEFKNYLSNDENTLSLYEMLDYAKFINNKECARRNRSRVISPTGCYVLLGSLTVDSDQDISSRQDSPGFKERRG